MKKVNFNIRIEEEMRNEFKKIAKDNVQNPSALVRKWIDNYIRENKKTGGINMEIIDTEYVEGFKKDMTGVVSDGEFEYVLSKVTYDDGSEKYEVDLEIDNVAGSFQAEYFDTEDDAREYIKKEI